MAAFAYEVPTVFIETNIRRVFLHEWFGDSDDVTDKELMPWIEATLDREQPRAWYWALMDYGADLVRRVPNPNRRSRHHVVQSRFEGSVRQLRGEVLRRLLAGAVTEAELRSGEGRVGLDDERLGQVLEGLLRDGVIVVDDNKWRIAGD